MEVLRGWRLLQAAGLTAEEKRDILSTTKNSLDYETIASALQNLWDEQLLGHRRGNGNTFQNFAASVDEGDWFDPESSDAWHDGWDDWSSSYYAGQWGDDEWGHDWWEEEPQQGFQALTHEPDSSSGPAGDDPALREAQQAERKLLRRLRPPLLPQEVCWIVERPLRQHLRR